MFIRLSPAPMTPPQAAGAEFQLPVKAVVNLFVVAFYVFEFVAQVRILRGVGQPKGHTCPLFFDPAWSPSFPISWLSFPIIHPSPLSMQAKAGSEKCRIGGLGREIRGRGPLNVEKKASTVVSGVGAGAKSGTAAAEGENGYVLVHLCAGNGGTLRFPGPAIP